MKNLLFLILCIFVLISFMQSCDETAPTSNQKEAAVQEQLKAEADRQVGMPAITNFQQKRLANKIISECDRTNLICYAYTLPEYSGKPYFIGKCIGYGLPYATQYTNPMALQKVGQSGSGWRYEVLPQADPDGLFKPASADGTWLELIDPIDNTPHVAYIEPKIMVVPFRLPASVITNPESYTMYKLNKDTVIQVKLK